jgi:hypothetical protein
MAGRLLNITGQRFHRLVAIKPAGKNRWRQTIWRCKCDCGNVKNVLSSCLRNGEIQSCGCWQRQVQRERHTTHGLTGTKFENIYYRLHNKCNNPKDRVFKYYGGRGIKCLWKSFEKFRDDMYDSYLKHSEKFGEKNTTIDRINIDRHYSKANCRWATYNEQRQHRRNRRLFTFNGQTRTLREWADVTGILHTTLERRLDAYGWPVERALTEPAFKHKKSNK